MLLSNTKIYIFLFVYEEFFEGDECSPIKLKEHMKKAMEQVKKDITLHSIIVEEIKVFTIGFYD
jgi:hypothetical protein